MRPCALLNSSTPQLDSAETDSLNLSLPVADLLKTLLGALI
jgi:hypothetical protein